MTIHPIEPDLDRAHELAVDADANNQLCWTCGTCDIECPIFLSTERLRPQKIVRMANLGLYDSLLGLPDIWYCVSCRRCLQGCPNSVKPYELNRYLQDTAIAEGVVSADMLPPYRKLMADFQRVRWRAVAQCFHGELKPLTQQQWYQWMKTPIRSAVYNVIRADEHPQVNGNRPSDDGQSCFTCGECSSCCPINGDRTVFDPQRIIRMANLGLSDELLKSPAIWLCLGCRRCAEACSQLVSGYDVIRRLQRLAIDNGYVDPAFAGRLARAERLIFPQFLNEIDTLLGLYGSVAPRQDRFGTGST